jgi:hypothetical protein
MKREQFINTFLEGSTLTSVNTDGLIRNLVGMVFDLRVKVSDHKDHLEYMDDIARANDIEMTCRSCGNKYELPCELSEMSHEGNYCGRSEFCCP